MSVRSIFIFFFILLSFAAILVCLRLSVHRVERACVCVCAHIALAVSFFLILIIVYGKAVFISMLYVIIVVFFLLWH